jgi:hypothetical protein
VFSLAAAAPFGQRRRRFAAELAGVRWHLNRSAARPSSLLWQEETAGMLTDARWAVLEPLVEQCRPHAKVPPANLRRTVSAMLRRHANGAKWRSVPAELGPLGSHQAAPALRDG